MNPAAESNRDHDNDDVFDDDDDDEDYNTQYDNVPSLLHTTDNGYHPSTTTATVIQAPRTTTATVVQAPLPRRIVSPVPEAMEAGAGMVS